LSSPWDGIHFDPDSLKDVLINIGGFVPLGFFFCAYFATIHSWRRAAITTILLGASTSLAIEILQLYIPSRDSGMMDVITNTTGTVLGVALERCKIVNALLVRAGVAP
jgi:glycopeptide antibiotics resistance protein